MRTVRSSYKAESRRGVRVRGCATPAKSENKCGSAIARGRLCGLTALRDNERVQESALEGGGYSRTFALR